ncbi:acetyltransferase [Striga asiatica]|uniref:Acetyltransferase n=1 Tax=Striga asiatica TaxID=4170 RepID=A0A5A7NWV2_STRAF|nr:acetyltransferase [Striga asiatica]
MSIGTSLIRVVVNELEGLDDFAHERAVGDLRVNAHGSNGGHLSHVIEIVGSGKGGVRQLLEAIAVGEEGPGPCDEVLLAWGLGHVDRLPPGEQLQQDDPVAVDIALDEQMSRHCDSSLGEFKEV